MLLDIARPFSYRRELPSSFIRGHSLISFLPDSSSLSAQMQVFWVTDNDDPVRGVTQLHKVALNKRRVHSSPAFLPSRFRESDLSFSFRQDLEDRKIDLQPFFVPPSPLQEFDLENFYGVSLVSSLILVSLC